MTPSQRNLASRAIKAYAAMLTICKSASAAMYTNRSAMDAEIAELVTLAHSIENGQMEMQASFADLLEKEKQKILNGTCDSVTTALSRRDIVNCIDYIIMKLPK